MADKDNSFTLDEQKFRDSILEHETDDGRSPFTNLATKLGVDRSTMYRFYNKPSNIQMQNFLILCEELGIDPKEFIQDKDANDKGGDK